MGKHNYILAYDFIIDNGLPSGHEEFEILYREQNTLASLGVDYSKEFNELHFDEEDKPFNKLTCLMQDYKLAKRVTDALAKKGVLNDIVRECAKLYLLIWSETDKDGPFASYKLNSKKYYEHGLCEFNCEELSTFNDGNWSDTHFNSYYKHDK